MSGFKIEGLKIRYKEKSINETSEYSNQLENTIDIKEEPYIFLHTDGKLYIKDNTLLDPIDISKFNKPFNSITLSDNELKFLKSDGTEEISLSDITTNKSSVLRDNSLIYSNTKEIELENINILNELRENYFNGYGVEGIDIPTTNTLYSNIVSELSSNTFFNNFSTKTLRSTNDTIANTYIKNYVYGLTIDEVSISGSSNEFYKKNQKGNVGDNIEIFPTTLRSLEYFLNEDDIGFDSKTSDLSTKKIFGGKKVSELKDYLYDNLKKYDGTYSFISSIFDDLGYSGTTFSQSISGSNIDSATIGEYDNGYTTLNGSNVLSDPLAFNASGIFSQLTYSNTLQRKLLSSISLAISSFIINKVVDNAISYFRDNVILPSSGTDDDIFPTTYNSPIQISPWVQHIDTQIKTLTASSFSTVISNSLSNTYTNYDLNGQSIVYGGISDVIKSMNTPLHKLNNNWFDIDGFHLVTNKLDNKKGLSCSSNFVINVKDSDVPLTIEFRLVESITGVELDKCKVSTVKKDSKNSIGIYDSIGKEVPIELSYFGPITQYKCDKSIEDFILSNTINVGEHQKLSSSSNCASEICLSDDGHILKQLVDDLFTGSDAELTLQNESKINVPRIIKVQWRLVCPSNVTVPQIEDYDVFDIIGSSNTTMGENRISTSIFSIGDTKGKRINMRGQKTLDNSDSIQVLFEKPLLNSEYSIKLTKNKNVDVWVSNKTRDGFTIKSNRKITCIVDWNVSFQSIDLSIQHNNSLPNCFVDNEKELGNKTNFTILKEEGYL